MMFKIEIETGNEAFADHAPSEVARSLRALADKLEYCHGLPSYAPLHDANGNRVGFAQEERPEAPLACPECGDSTHLYRKRDETWNPDAGRWEAQEAEASGECTSCDWSGDLSECESEQDTCWEHRQPIERCPARCRR